MIQEGTTTGKRSNGTIEDITGHAYRRRRECYRHVVGVCLPCSWSSPEIKCARLPRSISGGATYLTM